MTKSLQERLAKLEEENARLKQQNGDRPVSFKVGDKGGLSMYGLGRFPVTLYAEQWEKLLNNVDRIKEELKAREKELKRKDVA